MRKITKIRRSIKAISPVISVLLMIAIAVVASLVVYAWVMGYIGGTTNKAGNAIGIPSFAKDQDGNLIVYVQNVGQGAVQLDPASAVYVNNALVAINYWNGNPVSGLISIAQGQTVALIVNYPYNGEQIAIKVVTTGGTFMQTTGTGGSGGGSATLTSTTLSCSVTPGTITLGDGVTASGSLMAGSTGVSSKTVTITYQLVGHDDVVHTQPTDASGAYSDSYTPDAAGSWSVTASFAGDSTYALSSSTPLTLTVNNPAPALDHFTFDAISSPQTTGVAFNITIRAIDQYGNAFTGYTGTNTLSASTGTITPTSTTAFTAGVWSGQVTLSTAGTDLTISTTGNSKSGTSNAFNVNNPAPVLDHFVFDTISSPKTAGTAFSITIRAIDQYGNAFTSYTGTNTLTVSSGTISPTSTGAFASGVWTGQVTLTQSGTGISISTSGSSKSGTSNTFTVNPGALDHFTFSTISSPQTAGSAFSITITAKDSNGNTVTSYTGTNTLTVSSGTISPTSTTAFTTGAWTGSVTLYTSGSGITIGTTGNTKTGTSNAITVNAGSGNFGNSGTPGTSSSNIEDYIYGSAFTTPSYSVTAQSITAYVSVSQNHDMYAAIYTTGGSRVGYTQQVGVTTSSGKWQTFTFASGVTLSPSTTYVLVVWSESTSGSAYLYGSNSGGSSYSESRNYDGSAPPTTIPSGWDNNSNYNYNIYCTYSIP